MTNPITEKGLTFVSRVEEIPFCQGPGTLRLAGLREAGMVLLQVKSVVAPAPAFLIDISSNIEASQLLSQGKVKTHLPVMSVPRRFVRCRVFVSEARRLARRPPGSEDEDERR